jgi:hypothetical protein
MKLANFYNTDYVTITQSGHGNAQGNEAFDFILNSGDVGKLYAPCDGDVPWQHVSGQLSYFNFNLEDGSYIQFVHSLPTRLGRFKKGNYLGATTWHHHHIGIWVKGIGWQRILEYMDRDITLKSGGVSNYWTSWSTYKDKHLNISGEPIVSGDFTTDEFNKAKEWNDNIAKAGYLDDGRKIINGDLTSTAEQQMLVDLWRLTWNTISGTELENNYKPEHWLRDLADYLERSDKV